MNKFYSFVLLGMFISLSAYADTTYAGTTPTQENVAKLYVATFNRAPDSAGLSYWLNDSGLDLEQIAESFFNQAETLATYNGLDNEAFVKAVYENLFNRTAEQAGVDYWVGELDAGTVAKSVFILAVINGAQDSDSSQDATILTNKTTVGIAFADAGLNDADNAKSILADITADTSTITTALAQIETWSSSSSSSPSFKVVDTGQSSCFDTFGTSVSCNNTGQDGAYNGNQPSYTNNGDGTITDNTTGLTWQKSPDTNGDGNVGYSDKLTQSSAVSYCSNLTLGSQSDWRLPNIKEMYSLINFNGEDASSAADDDTSNLTPFIDTSYFDFAYGDTSSGERIIDVQYATTTIYVSTTVLGTETMFGVNMADGRIKGYETSIGGSAKTFTVQCVRGDSYGTNGFTDNNDETISDSASNLMWEKNDSQSDMSWDSALSYCESGATGGYTDWRLPNAKEMQSIVDYTRSPDTTSSAAIDAIFNATSFTNEGGATDWGFYWTSTSHKNPTGNGANGVYISFGRALGYMNGAWFDVHGAGAQRSNVKTTSSISKDPTYNTITDANGNLAYYHGPQGDVVRAENYVRCVRDI